MGAHHTTGLARAVHAEWIKLRTVSSTSWLLVASAVLLIVLGAVATAAVDTSQCPRPSDCREDTTKLSLTGIWLGQVPIVVLAVLAIGNEYGTGMIHTTFAAIPRRTTLLVAKAMAVVPAALVAGLCGVLGSVLVARLILPGNGFTTANGYAAVSLADGPTLRAAVGTVLYLGLVALLSLGVATLLRDTAVAMTAVLSLLYVFPVITLFVTDDDWQERFQRYAPMAAGLSIQATTNLGRLAIQPWPGLGVFAAYAALASLAGAIRLRR